MTLIKGIIAGKEHRKPYRDSRRFDRSCRTRGGCSRCEGTRMIQTLKLREKIRTECTHDSGEYGS